MWLPPCMPKSRPTCSRCSGNHFVSAPTRWLPTPLPLDGPNGYRLCLRSALGKNPQLMFETHSEFFIPQIGAQLSRPPVLIQPDGGDFGCELTSEGRLARGWKPTDQHEPRR